MERRTQELFDEAVSSQRHAPRISSFVDVLRDSHKDALQGESFEDAAAALADVDREVGIRAELRKRKFARIYELFQGIETIQRAPIPKAQRRQALEDLFMNEEERAVRFTPRVADFYTSLLSELRGQPSAPKFEENAIKLKALQEEGDLDVLTSPDSGWEMKMNRIDTRLEGYLAGRRALDRREGKIEPDQEEQEVRKEKQKKQPSRPPSRRNESKPSMDEMSRLKEGERAPAHWTIFPPIGGYFREQSLSVWDSEQNKWREPKYEYEEVHFAAPCKDEVPKTIKINTQMKAQVEAGEWVSVPTPYTHGLSNIECGQSYVVRQDQNGDVVFMVQGQGLVDVTIHLAPLEEKKRFPARKKPSVALMPAQFTDETMVEVARVKEAGLPASSRGRALASYTRRHLTYSNDSSFNAIYDQFPEGYFAAIDHHRKADCDVANTYFAALGAALKTPVRHVVGHMVKGSNDEGAAEITSGTGHAWSEVYNEENGVWDRVDATPAGDPNMQEEDDKDKKQGSAVPGDYGEQEVEMTTDEKLEALRKKLQERTEELSYTREERDLAHGANIEKSEARKIVKELHAADRTTLPNGKLIIDVLSRLFNAIVESRKMIQREYDGPVRKSEGGEGIEDIVRHKIGFLAGDSDPISREKEFDERKDTPIMSGFDIFYIADKSGSMRGVVDRESLQVMQRRAVYLLLTALHRFENALQRANIPADNGLTVRSKSISFRGDQDGDIDLDKELGQNFDAKDKVRLWHSLTKEGSGNGDSAALNVIYTQILDEIEKEKRSGTQKKRLRFVIACSDGGPDDEVKVQQYVEALGKLGVVVLGLGLTETARSVPDIYTTKYSKGEIVKTMDDLPAVIAKHLVMEAVKLFPPSTRASAQAVIESVLSEFRSV